MKLLALVVIGDMRIANAMTCIHRILGTLKFALDSNTMKVKTNKIIAMSLSIHRLNLIVFFFIKSPTVNALKAPGKKSKQRNTGAESPENIDKKVPKITAKTPGIGPNINPDKGANEADARMKPPLIPRSGIKGIDLKMK